MLQGMTREDRWYMIRPGDPGRHTARAAVLRLSSGALRGLALTPSRSFQESWDGLAGWIWSTAATMIIWVAGTVQIAPGWPATSGVEGTKPVRVGCRRRPEPPLSGCRPGCVRPCAHL